MGTTVAIIIPYFGKWPEYFNIYLKGCEYNPSINILFFSDCPAPAMHPRNVKFVKSSLEEISQLVRLKLGLNNFKLTRAYKLCDLRPAYGKIFFDYIKDYNYWGYGDIDLIYGNLRNLTSDFFLKNYDVLSFRTQLLTGSLSIFKNSVFINGLYNHIENYEQLISDVNYLGLDETGLCHITWAGGSRMDLGKLPVKNMTYIVSNEDEKGTLIAKFENLNREIIYKSETIKFEKGTLLLNDTDELAYFHYVRNKNSPYFKFPKWSFIPDTFYITTNGFFHSIEGSVFSVTYALRNIAGFWKALYSRLTQRISKIFN